MPAFNFNKAVIGGNVGAEPTITYDDKANIKRFRFNVCVNMNYRDRYGELRNEPNWFTVTGSGRLAEFVERNCHKSCPVLVEGRLRNIKQKGSDGTEHFVTQIWAENIQFPASSKNQDNESHELLPE